jgi:RimJ/RimL family protein N-acetyltransferase
MLEGILVDLVPMSQKFRDLEHRWNNSEAVFFWDVGNRWITSKAQVEARQKKRLEENEDNDEVVIFGVQTKNGTPIGLFGIVWLHHTNRLGLLTALIAEPEFWGGGYGTDALLLFLEYAFDWLDLRKAWLLTMSANPRVMRQMEKVGFTLEARQRQGTWTNDCWADILAYGMLRDEWPGRAALIEKLGLQEVQQKG